MSSTFEAFKALILSEPRLALPVLACENCDYNSFLYKAKNCYLCFASSYLEDCFHCEICVQCKDSMDLAYCKDCELCYDCVDCLKCYGCVLSQDLVNCSNVWFSFDCIGCTDCFGCVGLRRKQYHWFNEPLSKEEYERRFNDLRSNLKDAAVRHEVEEKCAMLQRKTPRVYMRGISNENVFGDYVNNSRRCTMAFNANDNQDAVYLYDEVYKNKDCVDLTHTHKSELCYEVGSCDVSYNCNYMFVSVGNRDCEYGVWLEQCEYCFLSVNLKRKKFHILNRAYSEEEYFKKVKAIKEEFRVEGLAGENILYLAMKDFMGTKESEIR